MADQAEQDTWHPGPLHIGYDRDLFGPFWAQITEPSTALRGWAWAVRRLDGSRPVTVAHGETSVIGASRAARQAVDGWVAANQPLAEAWTTVWNVAVPVVACLRAPTGAEAYDRLAKALTAAGFDVYEAPGEELTSPFRAEDGTEESDPPPAGWPWPGIREPVAAGLPDPCKMEGSNLCT